MSGILGAIGDTLFQRGCEDLGRIFATSERSWEGRSVSYDDGSSRPWFSTSSKVNGLLALGLLTAVGAIGGGIALAVGSGGTLAGPAIIGAAIGVLVSVGIFIWAGIEEMRNSSR